MSTWNEDFEEFLQSVGMPAPGDFDPLETYDFIGNLIDGIEIGGKGSTVLQALGYVGLAGVTAVGVAATTFAVTMTAATYAAALVSAALLASAKQGWDYISSPIDMKQLEQWYQQYYVPQFDMTVLDEAASGPERVTAREDAPPPSPPYPGDVVKRKSRDTDSVERIQGVLEVRGYDVSVDGDFGRDTERAVKAFQKDQGIEVDGKVGPDTWHALFGS